MTTPYLPVTDAEFTAENGSVDLDQANLMLTPLDPEFAYLISHPRLSAQLAAVRQLGPEPTTALVDGSARKARDARIARRQQQAAADNVHTLHPAFLPVVEVEAEAA
ncbi:hypothetical protein [Kutzneria buriramensis]|uniref:Uncharacterized protein n=1 Tax=Kutzneria buriramensis TaxID=1045776 RepID=A0A3E0GST6_9PSEU|nr:hypothetical protein [Kutzneria buriramensis]REH25989.1 hypothetical protein BCF44_13528 [Kutzneria buriramensis]